MCSWYFIVTPYWVKSSCCLNESWVTVILLLIENLINEWMNCKKYYNDAIAFSLLKNLGIQITFSSIIIRDKKDHLVS